MRSFVVVAAFLLSSVAEASDESLTVPFITTQARKTVRGHIDHDGNLVELLPTELHGDG